MGPQPAGDLGVHQEVLELFGAGRAQGVKFVPYEIKKKRGRKPKPKEPTAGQPKLDSALKSTN